MCNSLLYNINKVDNENLLNICETYNCGLSYNKITFDEVFKSLKYTIIRYSKNYSNYRFFTNVGKPNSKIVVYVESKDGTLIGYLTITIDSKNYYTTSRVINYALNGYTTKELNYITECVYNVLQDSSYTCSDVSYYIR